ncbi:MAG: phosphoribosyltransferase family protein [Acidimicrobiales bacterium]|nr:phosphoribosyltransferase family protein [Acidimicrobiales bacterium]
MKQNQWAVKVINLLRKTGCANCPLSQAGPCSNCLACLGPVPLFLPAADLNGFTALASYQGPAADLVKAIKYKGLRSPIKALGQALAQQILAQQVSADQPQLATMVTWVPASTRHRAQRGADHAELLARSVAHHLDLPARRLLLRAPGPAQHTLTVTQRRSGPTLRSRPINPDARVLLIDDVTTTGASVRTAARALRRAGAKQVTVAVVAATPPRYTPRRPRPLTARSR